MAILNIQRTSEYNNLLRNYIIYIDGQKTCTIANGETKTFELAAGHHEMHCKIDWCSSPKISFTIGENASKTYRAGGFKHGNWMMPLGIIIIILSYLFSDFFGIYVFFFLLLPAFLMVIYYITIGRKKYLTLKELV